MIILIINPVSSSLYGKHINGKDMNALTGNKAVLFIFRSIDMNALTGNIQKPDRAKYNNKSLANLQKLFFLFAFIAD
ncbi:MAG: hypothetical protein LBL13_06730 [Bacteroidales bacterium]|jgi:hypothetical protein|nr:hypothetical protein [Bacteroidales bacterium]